MGAFYLKMKADHHRWTTEFKTGSANTEAVDNARRAYEDAAAAAGSSQLALRLGIALNLSVLLFEGLGDRDEANRVARAAFDDAIVEIDNAQKDGIKVEDDVNLICGLLRDNVILWSSDQDDGTPVAHVESSDACAEPSCSDSTAMPSRDELVCLAQLAEQSEEMTDHMKMVSEKPQELSVEERNLFSIAFKNAAGSRRSSWRIVKHIMQKAEKDSANAKFACEYALKIEAELSSLCETALELLGDHVVKASTNESNAFYLKMMADYRHYLLEIDSNPATREAAASARKDCEEAQRIQCLSFPVTHPIRLDSALRFSVFTYEVLGNAEEAIRIARTAFEDAVEELDNLQENDYKAAVFVLQPLRDNVTLWGAENSIAGAA